MKLLLDTQVMKAWLTGATDRLSAETIALLQDPQNERYYSTASIWELSLKEGMGASNVKLNPHQVVTELKEQGFIELSLRAATLWRAFRLSSRIQRDPFDRLLLAQAQQKGLKLLTVDPQMLQHELPVVLAASAPGLSRCRGASTAWTRRDAPLFFWGSASTFRGRPVRGVVVAPAPRQFPRFLGALSREKESAVPVLFALGLAP